MILKATWLLTDQNAITTQRSLVTLGSTTKLLTERTEKNQTAHSVRVNIQDQVPSLDQQQHYSMHLFPVAVWFDFTRITDEPASKTNSSFV